MSNPGTPGLSAYWRMDELSGTRYDSSYSGSHLIDYNTVGYDRGRRVWSADFVAANNEYLAVPNNLFINFYGSVQPFTLGCWIKVHKLTETPHIFSKWRTSPVERQYVLWMNGDTPAFSIYSGGDFPQQWNVHANTFGSLNVNKWYFLCAYWQASSPWPIAIGVNDVWDTLNGPSDGLAYWTNPLYIGGEQGGESTRRFDGLIDEMFIYNYDLSAAQRTWMYNDGYGRTYADIVDDPPPSVEIDISPETLPIYVYDSTFELIGIIEDYYSLIWAERYSEVSDFELELPIHYESDPLIAFGNFLYIKISDKLMIIEDTKPEFGEDKTSLLVTGESAESILKRRIIEDAINIGGRSEIMIYDLVRFHITEPSDSDREISLFKTDFPAMLTTQIFEEQFENQTLHEAIKTICKNTGLGFKIIYYDDELVFLVYEGIDRSTDQSENDYVMFSEVFNNIISSSYYSSEKDKVTIVLVLTDDTVYPSVYVWASGASEPADLDRIETFLETNIDRDAEATSLTDAQVLAIIKARGRELINEHPIGIFEGDFDIQGNFKYGVDFFMGDIVQCDISGKNVKARIIEVVHSYSAEGRKSYVAMDFTV